MHYTLLQIGTDWEKILKLQVICKIKSKQTQETNKMKNDGDTIPKTNKKIYDKC